MGNHKYPHGKSSRSHGKSPIFPWEITNIPHGKSPIFPWKITNITMGNHQFSHGKSSICHGNSPMLQWEITNSPDGKSPIFTWEITKIQVKSPVPLPHPRDITNTPMGNPQYSHGKTAISPWDMTIDTCFFCGK